MPSAFVCHIVVSDIEKRVLWCFAVLLPPSKPLESNAVALPRLSRNTNVSQVR